MTLERREFTRVKTRLITFLTIVATGKVERALTKDLGGKGLCCITEGDIAPDTKLEIKLQLPDREKPIICTASVVWSQLLGEAHKSYEMPPAETGIQFIQIDPDDRTLIIQYAKLNAAPPDYPQM